VIDLDELDRKILDRLANLGRTPLRLGELVNENRDHGADADTVRRHLVRLEMAGLIRTEHYYTTTGDGAAVALSTPQASDMQPVGSAQNA
jgi:DNA-binding Lrp family transcriptional regulator